jgi:alpha-L-fucosidase 2
MRAICIVLSALCCALLIDKSGYSQPQPSHDIVYEAIPDTWDQGMPLGNGRLGAMVWKKSERLRFSLDCAELWDLRTIREFDLDEWNYSWVYQRWLQPKEYTLAQQLFDTPYEEYPAPTKIPAAYLEFPISDFGPMDYARLSLRSAVCEIQWENGVKMTSYIHADKQYGFFELDGLKEKKSPELSVPQFQADSLKRDNPKGLQRLGYPPPLISRNDSSILIHQETSEKSYYEVLLKWKYSNNKLSGFWSIKAFYPGDVVTEDVTSIVQSAEVKTEEYNYSGHLAWWEQFWEQSSVSVPDTVIMKQYYRDLYKLGCVSRKGGPAASLQAIWTSDHDNDLPPWKNDFHNDMNTQMTYWPCYASNHLAESSVFTDWLWNYKPVAIKYTRKYFGADGLNFPGVCALNAYPLGGWIQYAFSTTTSAWLSQHFYWQWKYSMDTKFLKKRAYPWVKEAGEFIEKMSVFLPDSTRVLLMSSTPEMYDNSEKAWFRKNTNFDLALIRSLYQEASEMAGALGLQNDKARWDKNLTQWSQLTLDKRDSSLLLAYDHPLGFSHRHHSHLAAIYPLGLIDCFNSPAEMTIVKNSLNTIDKLGTKAWCGYSFAWYALLQARAGGGKKSAEALHTFIDAFTSSNSFHVNGDQTSLGYSDNHDRILTLEGNMGFAAAVQEMLLQSYQGVIRIFPAIHDTWINVSFINLRAEGAFVISAIRDNGMTRSIRIIAEKGGLVKLLNPFKTGNIFIAGTQNYRAEGKILLINTNPGQVITITSK